MNDSQKFRDIISRLKKKLDVISDNIDEIVKRIDAGTKNWSSIRNDLNYQYEKARRVINEWARQEIPSIYKESLKETIADLKNAAVKLPKIRLSDLDKPDTALREILNNTLTAFHDGLSNGEQTLLRLVNVTQQINLTEAKVNKAIAEGFEEKGTAQAARKKLQQELMRKAQDGKYIEVIDKNGDTINYNVKAYAELVARTKLSDAAAQAVLNTADKIGEDLVQVSSHNTLTPQCAEYEGKIFSLSGKSKYFPVLDQSPPFHINCLHSISIVFEEALIADGTFDKYVAFSNNETNVHPTLTGYIPVSEREMVNAA